MFPATRWRLGPPLCPCFEAPSLSEADLVPAMTASCGLSWDGLGRPHSKMHQWRRTRVTNKFRWPSCSGPGRYSSSSIQPGRGCRRRIPVSVSLGRSAVSGEEEVGVFSLVFGFRSPSPDTCHFMERTSRRTPFRKSGSWESPCLTVNLYMS